MDALDLASFDRFRPLKRSEYDKLVDLGAFEDEHIELIHGILVPMSPAKPPHAYCVDELEERLKQCLGERAKVRVEKPFLAFGESEPEPDIAVVPREDYRTRHPETAWLIVEVSDDSLRKDRRIKGPLYAASGVPEYWIVNIKAKRVEIHTELRDGKYTVERRVGPDGTVSPLAFPDVQLRVSDFLP